MDNRKLPDRCLLILERDVGLFSLIQQVVANIPRAEGDQRTPIVFFGEGCAYFRAGGYADRDSVWEYYFEPVVAGASVSVIPEEIRRRARAVAGTECVEIELAPGIAASNHFGDHPELSGRTLRIPYTYDDPGPALRARTSAIIGELVRPREYISRKVKAFHAEHLAGSFAIGVHVRGTDAISKSERRHFRKNSLSIPRYERQIGRLLQSHPSAKIFVATDSQSSLDAFLTTFGDRVVSYNSLRHTEGPAAGTGPQGKLMPAYVAQDPEGAARNGEEAVVEYLLLCRTDHLVHNGSTLARTVLLTMPGLAHTNTHQPKPSRWATWRRQASGVRWAVRGRPVVEWPSLLKARWKEEAEYRRYCQQESLENF